MRLAEFIEKNTDEIVSLAESFAATLLPAAGHLDSEALRDHLPVILQTIATDIRTAQTADERLQRSLGKHPKGRATPETAAQTHALLRAKGGFEIEQMVAEYRALRASVLRLWMATEVPVDTATLEDMARFNEAIDQGVAESVAFFTAEVDRWREVFLGVLGHDLRGPLNSILLTSELLSKMGTREPVSDYTQRLLRSGTRMKVLLDDLLDYSRSSLGLGIRIKRAPVDVATACAEECELLRSALPDQKIDFASQGQTFGNYDGSRVREILGNLVTNAAKYGTVGGAIGVRLTGADQAIRLEVENLGEAISGEAFESFFEPLRRGAVKQTDRLDERSNLGLGLFIVREIAKAHGGAVRGESIGGKILFSVTLIEKESAEG